MSQQFPGASPGIDFATRLVSQVAALHREKMGQERERQQKQKDDTVNILLHAVNNPNLNPADHQTLWPMIFKAQGAKGPELDQLASQLPHLFQDNTVDRGKTYSMSPDEMMPAATVSVPSVPGGADMQMTVDAHAVPGVPVDRGHLWTPAIRFLSPQERAQNEGQAEAIKQDALLPSYEKKQKILTGGRLAVEDAKTTAKSAQLNQRYDFALKKLNIQDQQKVSFNLRQLRDQYLAAGQAQSLDEATQMAGAALIDGVEAKARLANSTADFRDVQTELAPVMKDIKQQAADASTSRAATYKANAGGAGGGRASNQKYVQAQRLVDQFNKLTVDASKAKLSRQRDTILASRDNVEANLRSRFPDIIALDDKGKPSRLKAQPTGVPAVPKGAIPLVAAPGKKSVTDYAQKHGMTVEDARKKFETDGWLIQ
jgi:hypothetical protein